MELPGGSNRPSSIRGILKNEPIGVYDFVETFMIFKTTITYFSFLRAVRLYEKCSAMSQKYGENGNNGK